MGEILDYIEPVGVFAGEILNISDPQYQKIALEALQRAPEYFWIVPASSTGKYHPKSSLGIGGLVRHVKAVYKIAEQLFGNSLLAPFTEEEKNRVRVAILLHDACKQGAKTHLWGSTSFDHPVLVFEYLMPKECIQESQENYKKWEQICDLIESHMGPWNSKEGYEDLPLPETELQKFVHLCDYLASRKCIETI